MHQRQVLRMTMRRTWDAGRTDLAIHGGPKASPEQLPQQAHRVRPRSRLPLPNLLLALLLACAPPVASDPGGIFDGVPKRIVVNGYSTSFKWPALLQRKLDRFLGNAAYIEVVSAVRKGTPIARWMDLESGRPSPAWQRLLKPALDTEQPVLVLAQQSLQWAFGKRGAGIRGHDDRERIAFGADVLALFSRKLLEGGADRVFVATHVYKHSMEPEIGNERFALKKLERRELPKVHVGPDLWEPTRQHYPGAFRRDGVHPNRAGAEMMAQLWFETLSQHDRLPVPEWSRAEMHSALD